MLHIENLHIHYGPIEALKGIDLDIHEGEIVTLIGANGAGKSTLLNTICGSPRASAGKIEYRGENLTRVPTHKISQRGIALVPEGRRIFPALTIEENLELGGFHQTTKKAWSTSTSFSRASWSGAASARAPSPAANSKCSPSAAG